MRIDDPVLKFGLELRQLRYFLEVAEARSLSAAARNIHYSQPPLSRQIRHLENLLDVRLFYRDSTGVALTEAGEILRRHAETLFEQLSAAVQVVRSSWSNASNYLNVGFTPSPTEVFRDYAIRMVEKAHPNIRIILHDIPVEHCIRKLVRRQLQFALTVEPRARNKHLQFVPLVSYEMRCAVAAAHPLGKRKHVTIKQLANEQLLIFSRQQMPQYAQYLRDAFRPHKVRLSPTAEFDGISTLLPAVEHGHGAALLLESAERLASKDVKWLSLRPALPKVRVGILYHTPANESLRRILETLKKAVRAKFAERTSRARQDKRHARKQSVSLNVKKSRASKPGKAGVSARRH